MNTSKALREHLSDSRGHIPRWFTVRNPRLMGGEHPCPGGTSQEQRARLRMLCAIGVTTFVDLVDYRMENGVEPYRRLLPHMGRNGIPISHHHFPVPDAGIPRSRGYVEEILDVIDISLLNAERVYMHCRSGVGRTGTLLALHLVRHGRSPESALEQVGAAWTKDPRSAQWPTCPQTTDQRHFVMRSV